MKPRKPKAKSRTAAKSAKWWISAAAAERNPTRAKALYRAALREWPRSADLLGRAAGHLHKSCHDRAGAEALYRRAVAAAPGNDFLLEQLTEFLCEKPGGWKDAAQIYRDVIRRDPGDISARHSLIWILTQNTQDLDAAERLHRECVRLAPRDAHELHCLGCFLRDFRGDPAAAARLYTRAMSLPGEDPDDSRFLRDKFLREARRNDAIERPLRRALARDPRDAAIRRALGLFLIGVRYHFEEGERLLHGTVPAELRTPAALRAAARIFEPEPETGREWALQIEWAAQLAPHHPGIARRYAALKHPGARHFDEGTESLV